MDKITKNIAFISENVSNHQIFLKTIKETGSFQHLHVNFFTEKKDIDKFSDKKFISQFDAVISSNLKEENLKTIWEEDAIIAESLDISLCRDFIFININPQNIHQVDILHSQIAKAISFIQKYFLISVPRLAILFDDNSLKPTVDALTLKLVSKAIPAFAMFKSDCSKSFFGQKFDVFVNYSTNKEHKAIEYFDGLKLNMEFEAPCILVEAIEQIENEEEYLYQTLCLLNDMLRNAIEYAELTKNPLPFSLKRENNEFKAF